MVPRLLALACALACLGVAVLAQSAPAQAAVSFGISDWGDLRRADFRSMGPNRLKLYRRSIDWRLVESSPGRFDFTEMDTIVRDAAAHWVRIQPILFASPPWIDRVHIHPPRGKRELRRFSRYVKAVVGRYGRRGSFWRSNSLPYLPMTHWQVWNEQHLPYFWGRAPSAREYLRLAKTARKAARSKDRKARILTGSVTHRAQRYMRKLLRLRSAPRVFDGVALNLYHRYIGTPGQAQRAAVRFRRFVNRRKMRRKPLYITEFGWRSEGSASSQVQQADRIDRTVRLLMKKRRYLKLRSLIYFSYRDAEPGPGFRSSYLTGLRTVDNRPKPAWNVLTALSRLRR